MQPYRPNLLINAMAAIITADHPSLAPPKTKDVDPALMRATIEDAKRIERLRRIPRPKSTIDKPHATPTRSEGEQAEYDRQIKALKITRPELNSKGRKKLARAILRGEKRSLDGLPFPVKRP